MPSPARKAPSILRPFRPPNARGLLQILPGTAKGVAGRHGLAYSKERLTTDAGLQCDARRALSRRTDRRFRRLLHSHLHRLQCRPAAACPNGSSRYGDPRGKSIDDVVDWIERIPFAETRNYVQRVMENYQVYKSRLGQTADIVHDLRMGR